MILPECHGETALVSFYNVNRHDYFHVQGSNIVTILKTQFATKRALILIDNDKKPIIYGDINNWKLREESLFSTLRQNDKHFAIVKNSAGIEGWVKDVANHNEIDLGQYALGPNLKRLTSQMKSPEIIRNGRFKEFLNTCKQRKCEEILTTQDWISRYLKKKL